MKEIGIGILGFGTVGAGVAEGLLKHREVIALRSGVDVKTVQHNLGHKTAMMTLDVYAAYTEDAGKDGAKKLSSYLKHVQK